MRTTTRPHRTTRPRTLLATAALAATFAVGLAVPAGSASADRGAPPAAATAASNGSQASSAHGFPEGGASAQAAETLRTSPQARIAARFYRPLETGDVTPYLRLLTPDWDDVPLAPGQGPGRDGFTPVVEEFHTAFPDLRVRLEGLHVAGDFVTVRTQMSATHSGPFLGAPGTGRQVTFRTIDVHEIRQGRIVRSYHIEDLFGLYAQMTAPTPTS